MLYVLGLSFPLLWYIYTLTRSDVSSDATDHLSKPRSRRLPAFDRPNEMVPTAQCPDHRGCSDPCAQLCSGLLYKRALVVDRWSHDEAAHCTQQKLTEEERRRQACAIDQWR
jgi:hypothetical protein